MSCKCHHDLSSTAKLVRKGLVVIAAALSPAILTAQSGNTPTLQVLYAFKNGTDGGYPVAPLIRDNAGNLYGTTPDGGMGCGPVFQYCGVVFELAVFRQWPFPGAYMRYLAKFSYCGKQRNVNGERFGLSIQAN